MHIIRLVHSSEKILLYSVIFYNLILTFFTSCTSVNCLMVFSVSCVAFNHYLLIYLCFFMLFFGPKEQNCVCSLWFAVKWHITLSVFVFLLKQTCGLLNEVLTLVWMPTHPCVHITHTLSLKRSQAEGLCWSACGWTGFINSRRVGDKN